VKGCVSLAPKALLLLRHSKKPRRLRRNNGQESIPEP
jgi:hypothetical protein